MKQDVKLTISDILFFVVLFVVFISMDFVSKVAFLVLMYASFKMSHDLRHDGKNK